MDLLEKADPVLDLGVTARHCRTTAPVNYLLHALDDREHFGRAVRRAGPAEEHLGGDGGELGY